MTCNPKELGNSYQIDLMYSFIDSDGNMKDDIGSGKWEVKCVQYDLLYFFSRV